MDSSHMVIGHIGFFKYEIIFDGGSNGNKSIAKFNLINNNANKAPPGAPNKSQHSIGVGHRGRWTHLSSSPLGLRTGVRESPVFCSL